MNGTQLAVVALGALLLAALGVAAASVGTTVEGSTAGSGAADGSVDRGADSRTAGNWSVASGDPDVRIGQSNGSGNGTGFEDSGGDAGGGSPSLDSPVGVLALVVGVALVAVVVAVRTGGRSRPDPRDTEDDPNEDGATLTGVGRAAGRAADRMASADPDNAVYRAWHDMTRLLDLPDPETATPGELAEAAVGAGMDPADVSALTDAFETVRYGGAEITSDRKRRARDALRRIEATYVDDPDRPGGPDRSEGRADE